MNVICRLFARAFHSEAWIWAHDVVASSHGGAIALAFVVYARPHGGKCSYYLTVTPHGCELAAEIWSPRSGERQKGNFLAAPASCEELAQQLEDCGFFSMKNYNGHVKDGVRYEVCYVSDTKKKYLVIQNPFVGESGSEHRRVVNVLEDWFKDISSSKDRRDKKSVKGVKGVKRR